MNTIVKKFGGTSVGSIERIEAVADQLVTSHQPQQKCVVVVSAMSGETDRLINLAQSINPKAPTRELAALITTGEQVSMSLLAMALSARGIKSKSYNGSQLAITTDEAYTKARILHINTDKLQQDLNENHLIIVAGFQGVTHKGDITALGRGGSDTSAVAIAAALKADECQIFTDVEGVFTADPRLVPKAYLQAKIDFRAMLECANLGSKVLQLRSVELAGKYQVPLRILSSFKPGSGTLINYINDAALEAPQLTALSHQLHLNRIIIRCPLTQSNALAMVTSQLSKANINIEHIAQSFCGQTLEMKFVLSREEIHHAEELLMALCQQYGWQIERQVGLARLALVGLGIQSYPWISAHFFETLQLENIQPQEIIHSEFALGVILSESEISQAAQALHRVFFEEYAHRVN